MLWKGPLEDGITQSLIGAFVQCPYRFYLKAILGLSDGTPLHPNLIWGDVFHKGLEHLILTKSVNIAIKEMQTYQEEKYPQAPATFAISQRRLLYKFSLKEYDGDWETEIEFKQKVKLPSGRYVTVRGKMDGLRTDHPDYGSILGEHKCKGYVDPILTRKELHLDRQVNLYCYLHDIEWINYDLILIPEAQKYSPARKYNESPQEYAERLFTGPCGNYGMYPINSNIHQWIAHLPPLFLPREKQEEYWNFTIYPEMERMCKFWDHVNQPGFDPDNPDYYNEVFYKTPIRQFNGSFTKNFECDFYNYLIGDVPLESLPKIETLYAELEPE